MCRKHSAERERAKEAAGVVVNCSALESTWGWEEIRGKIKKITDEPRSSL